MENTFIIEVHKGTRKFFVSEYNGHTLTWMKTSAKTFISIEESQAYIKDNELERSILWTAGFGGKNYEIVKYSEAKNH